MYQLIIHHDTGLSKQDQQFIKDAWNLGHVYLELREDENSVIYGVLSGLDWSDLKKTINTYQKYIIHGKERLELAKEYESQNPNDKILHSKTIEITEEQYLEGVILLDKYEQYLGQEIPSEIYGLLENNCADFVKNIYRSMGLEGDYTRHYRTSELQQINTQLTNKYKIFDLHPGDKPFTVFGSSIEEVAKKYNIDVSKVSKKEPTQGIPDMEVAMMQEAFDNFSFVIEPNPKLLNTEEDLSNQKMPELVFEHSLFNVPNKTINELLNNQGKLADYQKQSMKLAMEGLNEVGQLVPGLGNNILKSANEFQLEHGDFLASIINPPYYKAEEKGAKEFVNKMDLSGLSINKDKPINKKENKEESKTDYKSTNKNSESMDFVSSILQHSMPSADDMKWAEDIAKTTQKNLQNNLYSMENMNFLPSFNLPNTSDQGTANYLNNIFESFNVQNKSMDFMGKHDEHSDSD